MPIFEYDEAKSQINFDKHGINFVDAQELWEDAAYIEIQANSETEPRFLIVGRINEKHWSAVITYRDESIRIISVRRSRKKEIKLYES